MSGPNCLKGLSVDDNVNKGLAQYSNASVHHQLVITSKSSNSLDPDQNVRPDLGPNGLKWLSADDNVMLKLNTKLKFISSTSTCYNP